VIPRNIDFALWWNVASDLHPHTPFRQPQAEIGCCFGLIVMSVSQIGSGSGSMPDAAARTKVGLAVTHL
jgi:hypothetical protein